MEDDKIREIFESYRPTPQPSVEFMAELDRRMRAVESVKREVAAMRRRHRVAVVVAALSGFLAGVIANLLFPVMGQWIMTYSEQLPSMWLPNVELVCDIAEWVIAATACVIAAYNAYGLTLSHLSAERICPDS